MWGIYNFSQSPYVSWHEFARAIVKRATEIGLVIHSVEVLPSSEFPTPVSRPENSRLDSQALRVAFSIEGACWAQDMEKVLETLRLEVLRSP